MEWDLDWQSGNFAVKDAPEIRVQFTIYSLIYNYIEILNGFSFIRVLYTIKQTHNGDWCQSACFIFENIWRISMEFGAEGAKGYTKHRPVNLISVSIVRI